MVNQSQFIEETKLWENEGTIRDLIHNTVEKAGKKYSADSKIRYIDISSVDNETNTVTGVTEYIFKDAPSRAQQCVKRGDILVSTVRPNLKNIAVNHLDGEDLVASSGFCVLRPKEGCTGLIMAYILSDVFTEKMTLVAKGTNYPAIHDSDILDYKIRLPEDSKMSMIDRLFRQADKSKFAGFKSQFIEMFGNPMVEMQKYPLKKLGDCCVINPKRSKIALTDPDPVSFVPMPSVSEEGYLQDVSDAEYGSVKKGFTYFENGDVLFAKITPCMENGKGAIAHDLTNGVGMGSTEFHVLRPIKGISNSYWLLTLTRLPEFRDRAAHNMSGTGGQQRVRADFLESFMIGLPPIEKQKELENVCRVADKSKYLN